MSDGTSKRRLRPRAVLAVAAGVLASLDLLVKTAVVAGLSQGEVLDYGLFNLRLAYNTGVAFSLGAALSPWTVAGVTAGIVAVLALFLVRTAPRLSVPSLVGAALLLGGALGNLADRLDGAGVVDYLHTGWFPTFNLADVFVVTGAGLLALGSLLGPSAARNGN
ncbi:signal peptidase II [Arthrobacter sp. QXT-31]|uniref:signal peptidase II n=1 Tax=Arthrobacter sp. QXT-31 TaxID=1357915 RepID=UPI000971BB51|nr:signal peptidase II [Arthrobacter sp. QXT-31]APX00452.1 signal peptidase II [Arthrobacter sp. QXT-31]